ncbi:hypothetical protein ACFWP5_36270 [Streptomyces sp. NPDC058469]|uniref:hypothetical protein n=1 Tax=Streptomyces sp. NPDC058469 TaxID=3346514 RepID=UPI00364C912B
MARAGPRHPDPQRGDRYGYSAAARRSPGVLDPRTFGTTLTDDLTSRGYVVVTGDHTYEATAVEFPSGRVERTVLPAEFDATGGNQEQIRALLERVVAVSA